MSTWIEIGALKDIPRLGSRQGLILVRFLWAVVAYAVINPPGRQHARVAGHGRM